MYFVKSFLLLQSEYQDKETLTSIQFSSLKTRQFRLLHKFFLFSICHLLKQPPNVSMELFPVHRLLWLRLLFLLGTILRKMSVLLAIKTFPFLHKGVSFVE